MLIKLVSDKKENCKEQEYKLLYFFILFHLRMKLICVMCTWCQNICFSSYRMSNIPACFLGSAQSENVLTDIKLWVIFFPSTFILDLWGCICKFVTWVNYMLLRKLWVIYVISNHVVRCLWYMREFCIQTNFTKCMKKKVHDFKMHFLLYLCRTVTF